MEYLKEDLGALEVGVEKQLIHFLSENQDVFTWSPKDMPRINLDFLFHCLSIVLGNRPVFQKKRKLREEKRTIVKEEMGKLLAACIIREV
ncbi:hypothetical protein CR513_44896, partial [Mucuna pruriens]